MKGTKSILILLLIRIGFLSVHAQSVNSHLLKDIEGNEYKTTIIGNYEWMVDNLRTTSYNDGTKILNVTEKSKWLSLNTGAYCWYNNSDSNAVNYGALYNWYTVSTGKLCPDNWRVPSDEDWKYLEGYVDSKFKIGDPIWNSTMGRGSDIGFKLKAKYGWSFDGNGLDASDFSAFPNGERSGNTGTYHHLGNNGFWWSSTEYDAKSSWYRCLVFFDENIIRSTHPKSMGFSVRCIKDR